MKFSLKKIENVLVDSIFLAASGPLQGNYIYRRLIHKQLGYLQKCSGSLLSYAYLKAYIAELMISQHLDIIQAFSSYSVYEFFTNNSGTICRETDDGTIA